MFTIWLFFHIIVSIALILVVLMQSSKGEGLAGSAFGGGGAGLGGAMFGGRGAASFLSKATTVLAILFMFNCGALAFMSAGGRTVGSPEDISTGSSVITEQAQRERQQALERQQQQQQQAMPGDTAGQSPEIRILEQNTQTEGADQGTQEAPAGDGQ